MVTSRLLNRSLATAFGARHTHHSEKAFYSIKSLSMVAAGNHCKFWLFVCCAGKKVKIGNIIYMWWGKEPVNLIYAVSHLYLYTDCHESVSFWVPRCFCCCSLALLAGAEWAGRMEGWRGRAVRGALHVKNCLRERKKEKRKSVRNMSTTCQQGSALLLSSTSAAHFWGKHCSSVYLSSLYIYCTHTQ